MKNVSIWQTQVGGGNTMVSHPCVSQLILLVLLWLFVVLHLTRPQHPVLAPATPTQPESLTPTRHCSKEPKPFEGLTHKPHCAWDCATANVHDTHCQPLITQFDGHMMRSSLGVLRKQGEHCSPRDRTKRASRNLVAARRRGPPASLNGFARDAHGPASRRGHVPPRDGAPRLTRRVGPHG